ncbi:ABC transporter permease [Novispirillum sp. DQ9]|uniref:ABC transporter permease n=1 Tax=Novispirillum sp. DQ9 TaxID=3398612 RepID=UPI003C7D7ABD
MRDDRQPFLRRFARHKGAVAGAVVLLLLAAASLAAPLVEAALGVDANAVNILATYAPPSAQHPLGTDDLGRDVLVRLLYGGRVSLAVGLVGALAAALIGTAIGVPAGYFGGRLDAALMRLTDGVIALPLLPLLIVLAAADPAKLGLPPDLARHPALDLGRISLIIALVGWTTAARLSRGATLAVKQREFVLAAVALGAGPGRIMARHLLPNVVSPVIVAATLSIGNVILLESALSFLGLGIQPPLPSWGNMLTNALETVWAAPALAFWPGFLILLTVVSVNMVGDGLQDALDPRREAGWRV